MRGAKISAKRNDSDTYDDTEIERTAQVWAKKVGSTKQSTTPLIDCTTGVVYESNLTSRDSRKEEA